MISKKFLNKVSEKDFLSSAKYLGIAIDTEAIIDIEHYVNIESFFLAATYRLNSSRVAEGFLCWLLRYGHLLSPSKIRRLIQSGQHYNRSVLGGFILFIIDHKINFRQWKLLMSYAHKSKEPKPLIEGPRPKNPNIFFMKYNIIVHNYKMDIDKFLIPIATVYKNCSELRNRALFGSVVNSDVASFLKWFPDASPYQIAKETNNHKARVFQIYKNIKLAISI